jgi:hypothetical protein
MQGEWVPYGDVHEKGRDPDPERGHLAMGEASLGPVRVNPWYGWGFDTDLASGKVGLWNLTDKMVHERMDALIRYTGEDAFARFAWNKQTALGTLRNAFVGEYAHKKRATWDPKIKAFFIKSAKKGVEIRLDIPK